MVILISWIFFWLEWNMKDVLIPNWLNDIY